MCEARDALPPLPKKKDGPAAVIDLKEHSDEPVDGRQRKKMDSGG